MRHLRAKLMAVMVVTALAIGLGPASAAAPRSSANLELMAASIPGAGGTDIEFFSRTLSTYRDATGAEITPEAPVERHFALVGNQVLGAKIVDITMPEQPYAVSGLPTCKIGQGDPQVTKDGMLAAIAYQTSGSCKTHLGKTVPKGSAMVDLADVYNPLVIGSAPETAGSHNNSIHPSGKFLYISTSGASSTIPVYDISDPTAPKRIQLFSGAGGPHDIRFSADGKRAYTAGPGRSFAILNTENPAAPSIIATITAPTTIGHDVLLSPDGRFLFAGEELNGGSTAPCPGGAIFVYDMADEKNPKLLGAAEAGGGPVTSRQLTEAGPGPASVGGCTSHVMDLNPDGKSLTIGWYTLGTRVFSFSSFYNADGTPKSSGVIAAAWGDLGVGLVETGYMIPEGANTWSAKQYSKVPGYIFSDDLKLGLYVTKIK